MTIMLVRCHFWDVIHFHSAGFMVEQHVPGDVAELDSLALLVVPAGDGGDDEDLPGGVEEGAVPVLQDPGPVQHLHPDNLTVAGHVDHLHLPLHEGPDPPGVRGEGEAVPGLRLTAVLVPLHVPDQTEVPGLHTVLARPPDGRLLVTGQEGVRPLVEQRRLAGRPTAGDVNLGWTTEAVQETPDGGAELVGELEEAAVAGEQTSAGRGEILE